MTLLCHSVFPYYELWALSVSEAYTQLSQYDPEQPDGWLNLTASAFNKQGQYTTSLGHRGYCYAKLVIFFSSGGRNITSTHCTYPRRDGQAELAWVAGYIVRQFTCPKAVTHPSTNPAQCRATVLIETKVLPLHQTAT